MNIKEQLKKLPQKPGVYLMKDAYGNIIYVGKSKNLKNRVSSYFVGFNSHAPKVQTMVVNIKEFEYIITDSEMEALILEANLIKQHKPRFNVLLKDDKAYPYIKVTINEKWPRIMKTRKFRKDKCKYFGPYTDVGAVNTTIDTLVQIYQIRRCNKDLSKPHSRPCLNYHIRQCLGPCKGDVHHEAYMEQINEIMEFLSGKHDKVMAAIEVKMRAAAEKLNFEKATMYRDQMDALKRLTVKQKVVTDHDVNQDIIAWAENMGQICIMIFFVRGGKLLGKEEYVSEDSAYESTGEMLSSFLLQYYGGTAMIPKEIMLIEEPEDQELLEAWLGSKAGYKVKLHIPQRGDKKKLTEMVRKNAEEYLEKFKEKIETEKLRVFTIQQQLNELLGLDKPIRRIEAYDISNIFGVLSVGSMVVYEDGKKKRSDYRRFKIKTVEGADDYASMMEVLYRRFRRGKEEQDQLKENGLADGKFNVFPDLLLIDGGKGHVNAVLDVLKALEIDIPVAGMVKDDRHRTDRLYFNETMLPLKSYREAFQYVYGIQEEVHRFAVEYHRSLRAKQMVHSVLDDIDGIGKVRRTALLKHFKSVEKIKEASLEELAEADGMNARAAKAVYAYFHVEEVSEEQDV